jgi:hypothetical protein
MPPAPPFRLALFKRSQLALFFRSVPDKGTLDPNPKKTEQEGKFVPA